MSDVDDRLALQELAAMARHYLARGYREQADELMKLADQIERRLQNQPDVRSSESQAG